MLHKNMVCPQTLNMLQIFMSFMAFSISPLVDFIQCQLCLLQNGLYFSRVNTSKRSQDDKHDIKVKKTHFSSSYSFSSNMWHLLVNFCKCYL